MRTYEQISDILCAIPDEWFDKLDYWFDEWCSGSAPKARFTYWLRKVDITEDEYWMWSAM